MSLQRYGTVGLAGIFLVISVRAVTIEEVNAEIAKASEILKNTASGSNDSAEQRAKTLSDAVEHLRAVVEMIEKVPNLTPEERDNKASEVMTLIFWCNKMMPLNLSGGSIALAKPDGKASAPGSVPAPSGEANAGGQPPPAVAKAEKAVEYDEVAFNRAKAYAAAHPGDLGGCAARFETVAACYSGSKWAELSLHEAQQIRAKLNTQRTSQQPLMIRVEKLELAEVLETLAKDNAAESDKNRLLQTKNDIEALKNTFDQFVKFAEGRFEPLNIAFEELGLNRKGFIKSANKAGLTYTAGNREAPAEGAPLAWGDFGAKAMIRLAQKIWPAADVDALVQRAIAATVCEEYIVAQNCFARLLNFAPERVKDLNTYFVRAQYGYTNSAEVLARARFKDAQSLFKKRDFKSGLAALSELQKDLASNSSLATLLKEVNRFRVASRRQYQIDDAGDPISQFEKVMRATFAGDVKVDEASGKVEAFYDFADPDQFRDWTQIVLPAKPVQDWTLQNGRAVCSGQGGALLWRFPLAEFSVTADMVYQNSAKKVLLYASVDKGSPIIGSCFEGKAEIKAKRGNIWSFPKSTPKFFDWHADEVAKVHWFYDLKRQFPLEIYVNNTYATMIKDEYTSGGIGFGFEKGGTGSVTNIHITGKMDIPALKALLAGGPPAH